MKSAKPVALASFLLTVASLPAAAQESDAPTPPPSVEAAPEAQAPAEGEVKETPPAPAEAKVEAEAKPEASAAAEAGASASPVGPPAKKAPWRGSTLSYSHSHNAIGLDKGAQGHWNPYYLHRLNIRPQWSFGSQLYLRGNWDVGQELTTPDDLNRRYEIVVGDPSVDVGLVGVKDPYAGIHVSGGLRMAAGLSKVSQAQTRFLTISPGVSVARTFPVMKGLSLRYDARYSERLHRYTTTQYEEATLAICDSRDLVACAEYAHSGVRNTKNDLLQSASLGFSPHERVSLSAQFLMHHGFLYPLTEDAQHGLSPEEGVNTRYAWGFNLGASVKLTRELSLSLGASTLSAQQQPDSTLRSPFFNRYTNLYVDLGLDLEALLQRL